MFADLQRELSRLWTSLARALDRAGRDLADEAARRRTRDPRAGPVPTRLPPPQVRRPAPHPFLLPRRLPARMPGSVLERQRAWAARTRGETSAFAQAIEGAADRVADRLRRRLLDLQAALRSLQQRLDDKLGRRR
jgi:hypothetical protein